MEGGWGEVLQKEGKDGDYHKTVFQTALGDREGMGGGR